MAKHDRGDDTCTCKGNTTSKIALPLQTPSFRIKYLRAELESGEGSLRLEGGGRRRGGGDAAKIPTRKYFKIKAGR